MPRFILSCFLALFALPLYAESGAINTSSKVDEHDPRVVDNVRLILYHETAHALIDEWDLGISGSEEVAADSLSIMMLHYLHSEEEVARTIESVSALSERMRAHELDIWGEYFSVDQRVAWAVCLYYGFNPAERRDHARELGMPERVEVRCEENAYRINNLWSPMFYDQFRDPPRQSLRLTIDPSEDPAIEMIADSVRELNRSLRLPAQVAIKVEPCGGPNAYYHGLMNRMVFCEEMVPAMYATFGVAPPA